VYLGLQVRFFLFLSLILDKPTERLVFQLGMISSQARYLDTAKDYTGLGLLTSLLVITVLLMPLFQAMSLLVSWFAPLSRELRARNEVLYEILSAWQYMEVYVLSILIAAWQLGGVSEYMINEYCGALESTFNSLSFYGLLKEEDAQCFRINVGVKTGTWLLVGGSLLLFALSNFISGAARQKRLDDNTPSERRYHSDRWLVSKPSNFIDATDVSMSIKEDEEPSSERVIFPITSRFTNYFRFAVTNISDGGEIESDQVAEIVESSNITVATVTSMSVQEEEEPTSERSSLLTNDDRKGGNRNSFRFFFLDGESLAGDCNSTPASLEVEEDNLVMEH